MDRTRRTACLWTVALATLALAALAPGSARGDHFDEARSLLGMGELVVPDLRLEIAPAIDRVALILSFPIVVGIAHPFDERTSIDLFVEPQIQTRDNDWRVLAGGRFTLHTGGEAEAFGAFVETAGLAGEDGSGAVFGAGVSFGSRPSFSVLGLVYRLIVLDDEVRHDISIDLVRFDLTAVFATRRD